MEIKELPVDPALLDSLLDTHIDLPPVVSTVEIRHRNTTIGKLMLDSAAVDQLAAAQQSEFVRDRAIGPALRRDYYYRLLGALKTDVEFLLTKYVELLNVGEFNDLLCGWTPSVLDLLEDLPKKAERCVGVPIIDWSLEYVATHGSPQEKRRVAKIRRTAVPDGRGAPTKAPEDNAAVKIAAQVRVAEEKLKESFDRCVNWRKAGGHTNCAVFMSRALANEGYDPSVIRAVVPSRNLFTAGTRLVAAQLGNRSHRSVAEMARRGKRVSTSQRRSKHT